MCNCNDESLSGAVLAVYCQSTKRFLMLYELKDKPKFFKKAGMLALPSETREVDDGCMCGTVRRLITEEIGIGLNGAFSIHETPLTHFQHGVTIYVACMVVEEEFVSRPFDTDVSYAGWFTEADIRSFALEEHTLRIETLDVLDVVLSHYIRTPLLV